MIGPKILVLPRAPKIFGPGLVETQRSGLVVNFTSTHNNANWTLVSVYRPCQGIERDNFVTWLYNLEIPVDQNWLVIGDVNFIQSEENRNMPDGDVNDIFLFNEIIGHLGLLELQLNGRKYTWSNKQRSPLLEQLDWFFTSINWNSDFPNTMVFPMASKGSDHVPCVVSIDTNIPKAKLFHFENYWVRMPGFIECVSQSWDKVSKKSYSSAIIADKLKSLTFDLKNGKLVCQSLKGLFKIAIRYYFF
jgi:hypothetical protein